MKAIPQIGIYEIHNTVNDKFYVGQSENLQKRFVVHRRRLVRGDHPNKHLRSAWNKYGADVFIFSICELCSLVDLDKRESFWITKRNSYEPGGYNMTPLGGTHRGVKLSPEHKAKIAAIVHAAMTPERRLEMSRVRKGRKLTEEHKAKIKAGLTPEIKARVGEGVRAALKGRVKSAEHRAKLSAALKGRSHSPERCAAIALGKLLSTKVPKPSSRIYRPLTEKHKQAMRDGFARRRALKGTL